MGKMIFIYRLALCVLTVLFFQACSDDEDFASKYGNGSPQPENITQISGYSYSYNNSGLVTQIRHATPSTDSDGNNVLLWRVVADVTYPRSDRAVMVCYEDDGTTFSYVFAFGENNFASQVFETDSDGEYFLHKFRYDKEGHITHYKLPDEELRLEWTNGNLTKVIDDPEHYNAYSILTYGPYSNFGAVNMNPFLLDVNLGPFTSSLGWWFCVGLDYALYIGFLGKHSVNLPATMISYDNQNEIPTKGHFEYYNHYWKFVEDHDY